MRQPVRFAQIQNFLEALGREVRVPCRIYLVGGTSLVSFGLREHTIDIDVALEVADADHQRLIEVIRRLKDQLDLNIEEANPGDFIPLPLGWKERSPSVGVFGTVQVFHFDLYATALSKIERGTEIDFDDVVILLREGKIAWESLERCYQEILPHYGAKSLKQDPARIRRNFEILKQRR